MRDTGTTTARVKANVVPNGSAESRTIGPDKESAKTIDTDGDRRSSKIGLDTFIDYALGMPLDVLIIAEPGFEPSYAKPGDAGADLRSTESLTLEPGARALVKTGVKIAMPDGFVGLVHPRSGLAAKHGITVLNTPGTVDAGYRGELMVTLINTSKEPFEIVRGDRIAQLLFQKVERATFHAVTELPESARGETGFGSSGRR
jgi:dUTP pyrophosphatase